MRRLNPHRDYLQIFGMSKGNSPSVLLLADWSILAKTSRTEVLRYQT